MQHQIYESEMVGKPKNLIGKSKNEIFAEMGDGCNFFPDNIWTYELKKFWYGSKNVLFIFFEDDLVKSHVEKKVFGKISKVIQKNY